MGTLRLTAGGAGFFHVGGVVAGLVGDEHDQEAAVVADEAAVAVDDGGDGLERVFLTRDVDG